MILFFIKMILLWISSNWCVEKYIVSELHSKQILRAWFTLKYKISFAIPVTEIFCKFILSLCPQLEESLNINSYSIIKNSVTVTVMLQVTVTVTEILVFFSGWAIFSWQVEDSGITLPQQTVTQMQLKVYCELKLRLEKVRESLVNI